MIVIGFVIAVAMCSSSQETTSRLNRERTVTTRMMKVCVSSHFSL